MNVRRCFLVTALSVLILAPALPASSTGSTVGYWRFEEGSANTAASGSDSILDSSGSGDNGTPSGGPLYRADVPINPVPATGEPNTLSLEFDGEDDQVVFPSTFLFHQPGDATLEFWLKFTPTDHQAVFWTRADSTDANRYNIFVNADGTFGFDYRSPSGALHGLVGDFQHGVPVPADTWTHLAITRSGNHYSLYENGALVATANDPHPDLPTAVGWAMSGRQDFRFQGSIDEVRVSSGALQPSQFLNTSPGSTDHLKLDVYRGPASNRQLAYSDAGSLTSGDYDVGPASGSPSSISGSGTIPSTVGGNATVSFNVSYDSVAGQWSGTAFVSDPAAGSSAFVPVHTGRHGISRTGTLTSGTLYGIKALSEPRKCFMIRFEIDDLG